MLEFRKDIFAEEREENLHVVGKGVQRQDMPGHVTGRTRFFDDHAFEGLLHLGAASEEERAEFFLRHDNHWL